MSRFAERFARYREIVPDFPAFCAAHEAPAPVHLRVNPRKASPAWVGDRLSRAGVRVRPEPWYPDLLRVIEAPQGFAFGATLCHALGFVYIQSASSAVSARALGARPGDRVLDLCAAPGSKTTLLVQEMDDRGLLVANEPNRRRIKSLAANLERMGAASVLITAYAGQNFPKRLRFDRVLVDAPCSGEGTWRGPEAKPRRISEEFRGALVRQQTGLLQRAWDVLEPGGELVYSTCTYAPEENEAVLADLVEREGARVLPVPVDVPAEPGLPEWEGRRFPPELARARRLYPHRFDSEGFFVARLAKPG